MTVMKKMMPVIIIKICQTKNDFQKYNLLQFLKQLIGDFHYKPSQILFSQLSG